MVTLPAPAAPHAGLLAASSYFASHAGPHAARPDWPPQPHSRPLAAPLGLPLSAVAGLGRLLTVARG